MSISGEEKSMQMSSWNNCKDSSHTEEEEEPVLGRRVPRRQKSVARLTRWKPSNGPAAEASGHD